MTPNGLRSLLAKLLKSEPSPQLAALNQYLAALSDEDVRDRVIKLLADSTKFSVVLTTGPGTVNPSFRPGPMTRDFLARYQAITMRYSDLELMPSRMAPSDLRADLYTLGTTTAHAEVLVAPLADTVFIVDGTEPSERALEDRHRTIYHYLLWISCIVHPEVMI